LFYYIKLGLVLLLKTNLLEENVVNKQFSHVTLVFLRQVATGHFVDLTPLGIFFNLL
jgi:hypothetical protein